jgi:hypothetical protein
VAGLNASRERIYDARIDTKFDPGDLVNGSRQLDEFVAELDKLRRETPGDLAVHGPDVGLPQLWKRVIRGKPALEPGAETTDSG